MLGEKACAVTLAAVLFSCTSANPAGAAVKDSDGHVPVRYVCKKGASFLGFYSWNKAEDEVVRGRIVINRCALERAGAGPKDYKAVYQHELAHAHGKDHWQGSPRTNAAYYPYFQICRC